MYELHVFYYEKYKETLKAFHITYKSKNILKILYLKYCIYGRYLTKIILKTKKSSK